MPTVTLQLQICSSANNGRVLSFHTHHNGSAKLWRLFQMQMKQILEGRMEPVVHLPAQQTSLDKIPMSIRDRPQLNLTEHGVLQYLDDTMIHAPTEELLFERIHNFLERMRIFGIFIKPKKCDLWIREVTFLGWWISS